MKQLFLISVALLVSAGSLAAQNDTTRTEVLGEAVISAKATLKTAVTGLDAPLKEIPQSVTVINPSRLQEMNIHTLDEVMQQVVGVSTIAYDNMRTSFKSRGYQMGVLYDGMPAYQSMSMSQQLDLSFYEQVEVLRGPAGLLQGVPQGLEMGGLVNLVKKRALKQFGVQAGVSYGSWNNLRAQADINIPITRDGRLRTRWVGFGQTRKFYYDRSKQWKAGVYGALDFDITPTTFFGVSYVLQYAKSNVLHNGLPATRVDGNDKSRNITAAPRNTNLTPDWDYTTWRTQDIALMATQKIGENWQAVAKANFRSQAQVNQYGFPGTISTATSSSNYQLGYNEESIPRVSVMADIHGTFKLFGLEQYAIVGGNYESFTDGKRGTSFYKNFTFTDFGNLVEQVNASDITDAVAQNYDNLPQSDMKISQGGAFAQLRLSFWNPLKIILGGRLGKVKADMYDFQESKWNNVISDKMRFVPYAGLVLTPVKEVTAYASYSSVYAPQTYQRADGSFIDPNVGAQFEAGVKTSFLDDRLCVNVAGFLMSDSGRAYKSDPNQGFWENGGKVDCKGFETEVTANLVPGLNVIAGYTFLDTKITKSSSGDEGLAWSPVEARHSGKLFGTYTIQNGPVKGLSAGTGLMAYSARTASVLTPERTQKPYAVWNLYLSYSFLEHFMVNASLNNVLDTAYYSRVGGNGDFFGDPRNFMISLNVKF